MTRKVKSSSVCAGGNHIHMTVAVDGADHQLTTVAAMKTAIEAKPFIL